MAVYGFQIEVSGNAVNKMAEINKALSGMGVKATTEAKKVSGAFSGITSMFGGLKSMLLGGLGIGAAFKGIELIKDSVKEFNDAAWLAALDTNPSMIPASGSFASMPRWYADLYALAMSVFIV